MGQLIEFTMNHWMLVGALVLILVFIFAEEVKNKQGGPKLSPQDATRLMNAQKATVVDLREKSLFDNGHITDAIHLAQPTIMNNLSKLNKFKEKPIILVDTSGHQSAMTRHKLSKEGFKQLFVLSGGVNAWKEAGLPLVKK
jgi:rhodanese-related sulfurtransferase